MDISVEQTGRDQCKIHDRANGIDDANRPNPGSVALYTNNRVFWAYRWQSRFRRYRRLDSGSVGGFVETHGVAAYRIDRRYPDSG